MNQQTDGARELITGLVATIVTLGAFDTFQQDLEPVAGYIANVLGGIVISATIVFVVCLFVKMPRQKALATAFLLPPTLATFEQIRKHSVDFTENRMLSLLLAVVSAIVVGAIVAAATSRLTGVNLASANGAASFETHQSKDAAQ